MRDQVNIVKITCAISLLLFFSNHTFADALPSSLSDLIHLPTLSELECPTTEAEPREKDEPHDIDGLIGGASLNYTQALGNIRAVLEGSISPQAAQTLESNPMFKDPMTSSRIAAIAMADQKPLATLAALVKAHETAPAEPFFLTNLSGIANHFGLHLEALALTEKTETLPKRMPDFQRGILLNNKGYALTSLGRPQEAEAALKEAIRLAPNLSEAYNNLAFSLGDQDKCPQAKRYLRASKTRKPDRVLKATPEGDISDSEETPERLPLGEVIDLSRGKHGVLPDVPFASDPAQAEAVKNQLDELKKQTKPLLQDMEKMAPEAMQEMIIRRMQWSEQGASGNLTANFVEALMTAFDEYTAHMMAFHQVWIGGTEPGSKLPQHPDPDMRSLTAATAEKNKQLIDIIDLQDSHTWPDLYKPIIKEFDREQERCRKLTDSKSCMSLAALRKNAAICVLGKEIASQRLPFVKAYDQALRNLYSESFYRASAIAAHFSDPAHKKWTQISLGHYTAVTFEYLLSGGYQMVAPLQRVHGNCEASNYTPMDVLFAQLKQMADDCEASAKAKGSASIFEVSANCEQIEIGVSSPGAVGLFAQVSYQFSQRYRRIKDPKERFMEKQAGRDPDIALTLPNYGDAFDGQLTIFTGVQGKVSAPGDAAEIGVKAGGSTTFNGNGDIVNSGGKVEISGSSQVGSGGIGAGGEMDLTPMFTPSLMSDN